MSQSIYFFTRYWFSIGLVLVISLSVSKRVEYSKGYKTDLKSAKSPTIAKHAKLVAVKTSILPNQIKEPVIKSPNRRMEFTIQEQKNHSKFIQRFSKVAVEEMEIYGIPASIILAHALLESNGKTGKDNTGNNFFNLPCKNRSSSKICYQKYETAWLSFRGHSKYLTTGKFKYLSRIPKSNLENWTKSIQAIAYPNQIDYNLQLLDIIQLYQLDLLDVTSKKT